MPLLLAFPLQIRWYLVFFYIYLYLFASYQITSTGKPANVVPLSVCSNKVVLNIQLKPTFVNFIHGHKIKVCLIPEPGDGQVREEICW